MIEPREVTELDADRRELDLTWEEEEHRCRSLQTAHLLYDSASKPLTQDMRATLRVLLDNDDRQVKYFIETMEFMEKTRYRHAFYVAFLYPIELHVLYPIFTFVERMKRSVR